MFLYHLECSGTLTLSSSQHGEIVPLSSSFLVKVHKRKGWDKKFWLKGNYPRTKQALNIELEKVTMTGSCCWQVWDSYFGGNSFNLPAPKKFQPGWSIKSVNLVKDCAF